MIYSRLLQVSIVLSTIHRSYPDALPLFAGIVLIAHRELIVQLYNSDADGRGWV